MNWLLRGWDQLKEVFMKSRAVSDTTRKQADDLSTRADGAVARVDKTVQKTNRFLLELEHSELVAEGSYKARGGR